MIRSLALTLALLALCAGCGAPPAPAATPPPPPAAAAQPIQPSATAAPAATKPPPTIPPSAAPAELLAATTTPTAAPDAAGTAETPFAYQWPDYLPAGMAPAPAESRVARDGELGPDNIGFFIVTFNGAGTKLIIGGGAAEAFPISGRITALTLGGRSARMVSSGDQRQIAVSGTQGTLFVYGVGLADDELVRVAESLRPIDVAELRRRVGVSG